MAIKIAAHLKMPIFTVRETIKAFKTTGAVMNLAGRETNTEQHVLFPHNKEGDLERQTFLQRLHIFT